MNRKALTEESSSCPARGPMPARARPGYLDPVTGAAFDAVIVTDQDGVVRHTSAPGALSTSCCGCRRRIRSTVRAAAG